VSTPNPYTPQQALARDLLITAVNGAINHWARVHGCTVEGPAEQIRAEGIDTHDRAVWSVDIADISRAIAKLIATPYQCAAPDSGIDFGLLRTVGEVVSDGQRHWRTRVADLKPARPHHRTTTGTTSSRWSPTSSSRSRSATR
jgi:hypothetical protein